MGPDYQKQSAKTSLWEMDGCHAPKPYRQKGKGRGKDKRLVRQAMHELGLQEALDLLDEQNAEITAAWDCHMGYRTCEVCEDV